MHPGPSPHPLTLHHCLHRGSGWAGGPSATVCPIPARPCPLPQALPARPAHVHGWQMQGDRRGIAWHHPLRFPHSPCRCLHAWSLLPAPLHLKLSPYFIFGSALIPRLSQVPPAPCALPTSLDPDCSATLTLPSLPPAPHSSCFPSNIFESLFAKVPGPLQDTGGTAMGEGKGPNPCFHGAGRE